MKRIAVMALSLVVALTLSACGNNNQNPTSTTTNSVSSTATSAASASSASTISNAESVTSSPSEPIPEQLSETASDTASSISSTTALALKISEVPAAVASRWQEGVNYTRLSPTQPTGATPGNIEVTEVFWYGCSHCYALDPYLETWRKNGKAGYISFVRVPVMWSPGHVLHARLFYTAELLGKLDALHTSIFREMQVKGNPMTSTAQVEAFFTTNGVNQPDFQKAFSSFAVEASLKRAEALGLRYKVESVPLIIINGRYVTDVGQAGGQQQLISLINELAAREHGE